MDDRPINDCSRDPVCYARPSSPIRPNSRIQGWYHAVTALRSEQCRQSIDGGGRPTRQRPPTDCNDAIAALPPSLTRHVVPLNQRRYEFSSHTNTKPVNSRVWPYTKSSLSSLLLYLPVTTTIRLRFDGRSTAYRRSLKSQWRNAPAACHVDLFYLFIYLFI